MSNLDEDPMFDYIEDVLPDDQIPDTPPQKAHKRATFAPPPRQRKPAMRPQSSIMHNTVPAQSFEIENFEESDDESECDEPLSTNDIIEFIKAISGVLIIIFISTFLVTHKKFKDFILGYVPEATENSTLQNLIISGSVTGAVTGFFIIKKLGIF